MPSKLRVKFMARTLATQNPALWLCLFPERTPISGACEFVFDPDAREYDFLVVYEDLNLLPDERRSNRYEHLACARKNTLFITTEPSSIKIYGPEFLSQYGWVLSKQPKDVLGHPNIIAQTPPLRWYYGRPMGDNDDAYLDVDNLSVTPPLIKSREMSGVCSSKQMSTVFQQRYALTDALSTALGDNFDWYGRGVRPIHDKAEAMDTYRYHTAIENHISPGHWTEKIADCFLAFCLPFYYGDPDLANIFPEESFVPIDIYDIGSVIETVKRCLKDRIYETRLPAIIHARNIVLQDYNIMSYLGRLIPEIYTPAAPAHEKSYIYGRHKFRRAAPLRALKDVIHRTQTQHLIKND